MSINVILCITLLYKRIFYIFAKYNSDFSRLFIIRDQLQTTVKLIITNYIYKYHYLKNNA